MLSYVYDVFEMQTVTHNDHNEFIITLLAMWSLLSFLQDRRTHFKRLRIFFENLPKKNYGS